MPRRHVTHCRRKLENPTRSKFKDQAVVWQRHLLRCGNRQIKYQDRQLMYILAKFLEDKEDSEESRANIGRFFQEQRSLTFKKGLKILSVFLCIYLLEIPKVFYKRWKNSLILDAIHLEFLNSSAVGSVLRNQVLRILGLRLHLNLKNLTPRNITGTCIYVFSTNVTNLKLWSIPDLSSYHLTIIWINHTKLILVFKLYFWSQISGMYFLTSVLIMKGVDNLSEMLEINHFAILVSYTNETYYLKSVLVVFFKIPFPEISLISIYNV